MGPRSLVLVMMVIVVGEASQDLKLLDSSHIVITIPEHWDMISRRWRTRKPVQQVVGIWAWFVSCMWEPRICVLV